MTNLSVKRICCWNCGTAVHVDEVFWSNKLILIGTRQVCPSCGKTCFAWNHITHQMKDMVVSGLTVDGELVVVSSDDGFWEEMAILLK